MNAEFEQSFTKSLEKLLDDSLKQKIAAIINEVETSVALSDIKQLKKMKGYKTYYRIKTGDYRIGLELINPDTIRFILVSHRKDIYKKFP
jgi:mRNA interferase RelE/StbE